MGFALGWSVTDITLPKNLNGTAAPSALTAEGFCTREKNTLYGAFGQAAISTRASSFACGTFAGTRHGTWRSVLPPGTARITR